MKKTKQKESRPQNLKQKLMSALAMLLVSTILMSTTTYAWFVLSTAPEVTGIETQVGANGSLEIALLNTETRADMSLIRSGFAGGSLQEDRITANNAWGNLIDLSYTDYGLGELLLMPARLGVGTDGVSVDLNKLLLVPTYGYDGRIVGLSNDTVSAIYKNNEFMFSSEQDYGIRAVGTSNAMTPQGSALASAKTNIKTYTRSAQNNAKTTLVDNGSGLFDIVFVYATEGTAGTYTDTNRDALHTILTDLDSALNYIELSLRQGLVAYAAAELGEEETFALVRDQIMDSNNSLDILQSLVGSVGSVPAEFRTWISTLNDKQNTVNLAKITCEGLEGGTYTWAQMREILGYIMDVNKIYIEGKGIDELNVEDLAAKALAGTPVELELAPGSGLFADIADFVGNYSSLVKYTANVQGISANVNIEMETNSAEKPAHLEGLLTAVNGLTAAGGGAGASALPLTATYGYAIDLAFRCNAEDPDLILQTTPEQRVYTGGKDGDGTKSTNASTQGGGSYMKFSSLDAGLDPMQQEALVDAVRVGFLDDRGQILGIAKLDVEGGKDEPDGSVKYDLELYNYEFKLDEAGYYLEMGFKKTAADENYRQLTTLERNVAKSVTVVVWLDGDIVDNTMVSATQVATLDGVLNLQFATNADLIPAVDGKLLEYTFDKSGLATLVAAKAATADAGQLGYTNDSWYAFITAYNRAVSVNENENAGRVEVTQAIRALTDASTKLEKASKDAINQKTQAIRDLMGTISGEIGSLVIENADGSYSAVGNEEHTQEEHDSWNQVGTIDRVDYNKNMVDEDNGVYTTIYSDASWNALANALYQAEAVAMNPDASEDDINAALTALKNAEKALSRQVFYAPYKYNGDLYYMARWQQDAEDTYGRWYDSSFNRIVSEVTMLKLNAYAEPAIISHMGQEVWVPVEADYITPDIAFLEEVYPELRDVQVKGVHWNVIDSELFIDMMRADHYYKLQELIAIHDSAELAPVVTDATTAVRDAAEYLTHVFGGEVANGDKSASKAKETIAKLNETIVQMYVDLEAYNEQNGTLMTENQRILLTAAVNAAKAVDGYDTKTELAALRTATEAAEVVLVDTDPTKTEATNALNALNTELKAQKVEEVTAYNTLVHKLPQGMGSADIVYDVDFPGLELKLTGKSGTTTLGATVLTQDGVVLKVSKEITIYDRANGVKLLQGTNQINSLSLNMGKSATVAAELLYAQSGENTPTEEEIENVTWASDNTGVVTVSGGTITAVAAGNTFIRVSVETKAGNFYTTELPVIVN